MIVEAEPSGWSIKGGSNEVALIAGLRTSNSEALMKQKQHRYTGLSFAHVVPYRHRSLATGKRWMEIIWKGYRGWRAPRLSLRRAGIMMCGAVVGDGASELRIPLGCV